METRLNTAIWRLTCMHAIFMIALRFHYRWRIRFGVCILKKYIDLSLRT